MDTVITIQSSTITLHDYVKLGQGKTFRTNGAFEGAYVGAGGSLKFQHNINGIHEALTYYAPYDSEVAKLNRKGNWEPPRGCVAPDRGWDSYEILGYIKEAPAEAASCFYWSTTHESWKHSCPNIIPGSYHIRPKIDDRILDIKGRITEAQRQLEDAQAELSQLQKG